MSRPAARGLGVLGAALCLVAAGDAASQEIPSCEQTLWGCKAERSDEKTEPAAVRRKYDRTCRDARSALRSVVQYNLAANAEPVVQALVEATQLLPEQPEAWVLQGQFLMQLGRLDEAQAVLLRARALVEAAVQAPGAPRAGGGVLDLPDGLAVELDLAFLQAQRGDLLGGLERNRRVLARTPQDPRALFRTGDILMALGRLEEAAQLYERACFLPRLSSGSHLDSSRACVGLLVALDRSERSAGAAVQRRLRTLDASYRVLLMVDYLTAAEREYYRALVNPPSCTRVLALRAYLQAAQGVSEASPNPGLPGVPSAPSPAPAVSAPVSVIAIPTAFLRRAEERLRELPVQTCERAIPLSSRPLP